MATDVGHFRGYCCTLIIKPQFKVDAILMPKILYLAIFLILVACAAEEPEGGYEAPALARQITARNIEAE